MRNLLKLYRPESSNIRGNFDETLGNDALVAFVGGTRCWETKHWCHTKSRCSDYFSIIDLGIISTLLQVSLARSRRFLRSFCALRRWPRSDHRCLCRATRLSILSLTVWRYLPMSPHSRLRRAHRRRASASLTHLPQAASTRSRIESSSCNSCLV